MPRRAVAAGRRRFGLEPRSIAEPLHHREALGSTGLGNGIALPHARLTVIDQPFCLLARLREPLAFDAVDEKPVDLVCLVLLSAATPSQQLHVLSCIAKRLRDAPCARRHAPGPRTAHAVRRRRGTALLSLSRFVFLAGLLLAAPLHAQPAMSRDAAADARARAALAALTLDEKIALVQTQFGTPFRRPAGAAGRARLGRFRPGRAPPRHSAAAGDGRRPRRRRPHGQDG